MNEIKCPHCGKTFQLDENDYMEIVSQVRDETMKKDLLERQKILEEQYKSHLENEKLKLNQLHQKQLSDQEKEVVSLKEKLSSFEKEQKSQLETALAKKDAEIIKLQGELKNKDQDAELKVKEAVAKENEKLNELKLSLQQAKNELENKEQANLNQINSLKEQQRFALKEKDDQIEYYKNLKAQTSVKLLGETLEQHCLNSFNAVRSQAYPRAYFEKDNEVVDGSKGDFVFKNYDEFGTEYISIEFEMKNEQDETSTKHKNEDFFKKLDEDRKKKDCEYAVLVSLLEKDSDLYNQGIVDVSYRYPKMYVIRPQFFLPLISLLDNANRKNAHALAEIEAEKQRNIDITNFESQLSDFKSAFGRNYELAATQFADAIKRIDKGIEELLKVKDSLLRSSNNLRLANNKAQELTLKKLTKDSPSLQSKIEAIDAVE